MAHFAQLDDSSTVLKVIVVSNDSILDDSGQESEAVGIAFCQQLLGAETTWVQTSYNANFRGKYAGIGDTYDLLADEFVAPEPDPAAVSPQP